MPPLHQSEGLCFTRGVSDFWGFGDYSGLDHTDLARLLVDRYLFLMTPLFFLPSRSRKTKKRDEKAQRKGAARKAIGDAADNTDGRISESGKNTEPPSQSRMREEPAIPEANSAARASDGRELGRGDVIGESSLHQWRGSKDPTAEQEQQSDCHSDDWPHLRGLGGSGTCTDPIAKLLRAALRQVEGVDALSHHGRKSPQHHAESNTIDDPNH